MLERDSGKGKSANRRRAVQEPIRSPGRDSEVGMSVLLGLECTQPGQRL